MAVGPQHKPETPTLLILVRVPREQGRGPRLGAWVFKIWNGNCFWQTNLYMMNPGSSSSILLGNVARWNAYKASYSLNHRWTQMSSAYEQGGNNILGHALLALNKVVYRLMKSAFCCLTSDMQMHAGCSYACADACVASLMSIASSLDWNCFSKLYPKKNILL